MVFAGRMLAPMDFSSFLFALVRGKAAVA